MKIHIIISLTKNLFSCQFNFLNSCSSNSSHIKSSNNSSSRNNIQIIIFFFKRKNILKYIKQLRNNSPQYGYCDQVNKKLAKPKLLEPTNPHKPQTQSPLALKCTLTPSNQSLTSTQLKEVVIWDRKMENGLTEVGSYQAAQNLLKQSLNPIMKTKRFNNINPTKHQKIKTNILKKMKPES